MAIGIYKQVAKDIMTKHVATIRSKETIHDALMLMAENRLSALPVINRAGKCIGMISQSDIISMARDKDVEDSEVVAGRNSAADLLFGGVALDEITNERVDDMMSDRVVMAAPDEAVTDIADKMLEQEIHHIPVVDGDDNLVGIVSTMDILAALRAPLPTT